MNDGLLSDMGVREPEGRRVGGISIAGGNITGSNWDITNGSILLPQGALATQASSCIFFGSTRIGSTPLAINAFNNSLYFLGQGQQLFILQSGKFVGVSGATLGFSASATQADGTMDTILARDQADTFAQRRLTTAQGFNLYNTYTSSTNFERLDLQWASNICKIWTEKGSGGGTARPLVLGADATELLRFDTGSTIGFFAATPVVKQTSGANLTNNVTSGGTTDTITDWTNLSTYSTDAAAIRNAVYQLSRKLKQINDGLRSYGLFT